MNTEKFGPEQAQNYNPKNPEAHGKLVDGNFSDKKEYDKLETSIPSHDEGPE